MIGIILTTDATTALTLKMCDDLYDSYSSTYHNEKEELYFIFSNEEKTKEFMRVYNDLRCSNK